MRGMTIRLTRCTKDKYVNQALQKLRLISSYDLHAMAVQVFRPLHMIDSLSSDRRVHMCESLEVDYAWRRRPVELN